MAHERPHSSLFRHYLTLLLHRHDIVDKLKQEFELSVERLGCAIHPDTPQEGTPLTTMFPKLDVENRVRHIRDTAAPYGIVFADICQHIP